MRLTPGPLQVTTEAPAPELLFVIAPEPWFRNFLQNLGGLFARPEAGPELASEPAAFWPDVFVDRRLPWRRFLQSGAYHALALAMIWAGSRFLTLPHATTQSRITRAEVVSYAAS